MRMRMGIGTVLSVVALMLYCGAAQSFVCPDFIYGYGDSLTDTGNAQAELPEVFYPQSAYPYGKSYRFPDRPGERTRFSDGRLVLDFFAQAFGFPFVEPYSRRLPDAAYSHGVNFAYSGGTALSGYPPYPAFNFAREVSNFIDFNGAFTGTVNVSTAMQLIVALGGNDMRLAVEEGLPLTGAEILQRIDQIVETYKQNLERLHKEGARFFYIFNHPPAGCSPAYLFEITGKGPVDEDGCLSYYNAMSQYFNMKLKAAVDSYRKQWPDTTILLFDWYNATLDVIRNPGTYGIQTGGLTACCLDCYQCDIVPEKKKSLSASEPCLDPEHMLFWDGMHFSEGSNRVSATLALTGKFVDGPFEAVNLKAACNLDFSSFPKSIPNPKTAYFLPLTGGQYCLAAYIFEACWSGCDFFCIEILVFSFSRFDGRECIYTCCDEERAFIRFRS